MFGIGLPLSDGPASEKAALSLMLALAAMAALLTATPALKGVWDSSSCQRSSPPEQQPS
jgi:hypothetical protein